MGRNELSVHLTDGNGHPRISVPLGTLDPPPPLSTTATTCVRGQRSFPSRIRRQPLCQPHDRFSKAWDVSGTFVAAVIATHLGFPQHGEYHGAASRRRAPEQECTVATNQLACRTFPQKKRLCLQLTRRVEGAHSTQGYRIRSRVATHAQAEGQVGAFARMLAPRLCHSD